MALSKLLVPHIRIVLSTEWTPEQVVKNLEPFLRSTWSDRDKDAEGRPLWKGELREDGFRLQRLRARVRRGSSSFTTVVGRIRAMPHGADVEVNIGSRGNSLFCLLPLLGSPAFLIAGLCREPTRNEPPFLLLAFLCLALPVIGLAVFWLRGREAQYFFRELLPPPRSVISQSSSETSARTARASRSSGTSKR